MKKYNVSLIGCGQMGQVHLEHIYFKDYVNIHSVCDTDIEKAELFKRKYNALKVETDPSEVISDKDVDIVIIATYPSTHLQLLRLCLENGKHVICEKPIADNYDDGIKFAELVKMHHECKVLIGHILRHNKTYKTVAKMIREGAIGSPIVMRMVQNHHAMNWERYLTLINETSPIVDCGVHYMDVMQWFTGEKITDVSGICTRIDESVPEDKYNYGMVTVKLSGGSIGYYEAGWSNTMSSENLKEFIGPKGRIKITYRKDRAFNQEEGDLIEYYTYPSKHYEIINIESDRKPADVQFDHLIDMIENDVEASPSIEEVLSSFEAVMSVHENIFKKEKRRNCDV